MSFTIERKKAVTIGSIVACSAAVLLVLQAGELEPWGPPGGTMKPLSDIEPRRLIWGEMLTSVEPLRITQPGSYYLGENIDATGKWGIVIAASGVTIDLNGFALKNGWGMGIQTDPDSTDTENVVVRDGTVSGWGSHGIHINNAGSDNQVINVIANANAGFGIRSSGHLIDCVASGNAADGIWADGSTVVRGCRAERNGNNGIQVAGGSLILDSLANDNEASGMRLWGDVFAKGNICCFNDEAGIRASNTGNRIDSNQVMHNQIGIDILVDGYYSLIIRNSAWGNSLVDYAIPPGNDHGPIGSATQLTSPWANFDD